MQFRGGAVGHKTMQEETKCLLHDRNELDKVPFELEYERAGYAKPESDVEMGSGEDGEDATEEDGHEECKAEENDAEDSEDEIDDDDSDAGEQGLSAALANDALLDEMEEFGYTGLDEVVEEDEETAYLGENDLGAEDGENVDWDELEPLVYL